MTKRTEKPLVVVIAGPNGAGKSTAAPTLLRREHKSGIEFVNADVIAAGLSALDPESVSPQAGRLMLTRLDSTRCARRGRALHLRRCSRPALLQRGFEMRFSRVTSSTSTT